MRTTAEFLQAHIDGQDADIGYILRNRPRSELTEDEKANVKHREHVIAVLEQISRERVTELVEFGGVTVDQATEGYWRGRQEGLADALRILDAQLLAAPRWAHRALRRAAVSVQRLYDFRAGER